MILAVVFIVFILLVGLIVKIWKPGIDVLHNDDIVLWYTSPNTNERKFIYLFRD